MLVVSDGVEAAERSASSPAWVLGVVEQLCVCSMPVLVLLRGLRGTKNQLLDQGQEE